MAAKTPFSALEILWSIPTEISADPTYINTNIYRSTIENGAYIKIATVPVSGATKYDDTDYIFSDRGKTFYLLRYAKADLTESRFYQGYVSLTPREMRLVENLKVMLSPFLTSNVTDDHLSIGLQMGLNAINIFPPNTTFTINNFPTSLEPLLYLSTYIFALFQRYLPIAMTDLSYNDQGFAVTMDRGAKIQTAIDKVMTFYNNLLSLAKLDYAYTGTGLGTMQLPISIGGNLNKGMLNVLDIFQSMGR